MKAARIIAAVALSLIAVSYPSTNALADATCNTGRASAFAYHWAGVSRNASNGGVYSQLLNYRPYVDPSYAPVTAWVMTDNGSNQYAQVGWWQDTGSTRHVFSEATNNVYYPASGHYGYNRVFYDFEISPQPAVGTLTYYSVFYNNTAGKFTYQVANNSLSTQDTAYFAPSQGQIYGETHSLKSQIPGGYGSLNDHMVFGNSNIWISGSWQAYNGDSASDEGGLWGLQGYSTTLFHIWDKACQH